MERLSMMSCTKTYVYHLPDADGESREYETSVNSLIVIGANGSGKSKLGAWIEQQDFEGVHRIAAQRNLNFSERTPLKSYSEAEDAVFYGSSEEAYRKGKQQRWDWGKSYTTKLLDDFDDVLAVLIAQLQNENQRYVEDCKRAEERGEEKPHTRESSLDRLLTIWGQVFPHRSLRMTDAHFTALIPGDDAGYSGTQMSDGERSVLYLAAQVLCVPEGKTLIVDEPEVHLHPSLMFRLWRALENARPDCLFVFITHDTQLAASHKDSDKVWVKSYDGKRWELDFIPESDLPEQLLIELLGNRKDVLFVEGTGCSYDVQLYSAIYPEFYVVPCGGCSQVISNTKAFASTEGLHSIKAYGIIDRDYRSDEELAGLKAKGIYSLEVAEVENLFLVDPVLRLVAERFSCDEVDDAVEQVKAYVIRRFEGELSRQVRQATVSCLKEQLSGIDITTAAGASVAEDFGAAVASINPEKVLRKQEERFEVVSNDADYEGILKLFNAKGVSESVGHFFGVDNKKYRDKVIGLLGGDWRDRLVEALRTYAPTLP